MAIAIDFGTSNTAIARWTSDADTSTDTDRAELVFLPEIAAPDCTIPSLVYVEDAAAGRVLVGQTARDRLAAPDADSARYFARCKRALSASIQGFLPELDGRTVSFEQVGEWFLQALFDRLQAAAIATDTLILTVPVDSFERYRYWLGSAAERLAASEIRLLDEPTAAALGYGLDSGSTILVIDAGGGTTDFALVQLAATAARKPLGFLLKFGNRTLQDSRQKPQLARVLGKAGCNLGGSDIDDWLLDTFAREQNLPVTPAAARLVERLKIQLSSAPSARDTYTDPATGTRYELELNRDRFDALLVERGFVADLDRLLGSVRQQAAANGLPDLDASLDAVLLVGGTSQIPVLQTWARDTFSPERVRADRPLSAIATGALQLARGTQLQDFLHHSYGIRYWNRRDRCHSWHAIVRAGQPYPSPTPVTLALGASTPNQPSIELIIGELASAETRTEIVFDGDRLVAREVAPDLRVEPLNDRDGARAIAQLDPPGQPGTDRIRVQFFVDDRRYLRISVEDLLTRVTLVENAVIAELS